MNRREFLLGAGAVALAGCKTGADCALAPSSPKFLFGACRPLKDAALMKSIGYDYIEDEVAKTLVPDSDEEAWKRQLDVIRGLPLPLRACNVFVPGRYCIAGPHAQFEPALQYAERALRRAEQAGVKYVVFGSNGARNAPGDPRDPKNRPMTEEGFEQYIEFCRQLCARVADLKSVQILAEPLRPNGANYLNYVWQAVQVCEDVNSPRMGIIADIFHMTAGRERARSIVEAGSLIRHCHIADWKTRNYFGEKPQDVEHFRSYYEALRQIGYRGGISCETGKNGWGKEGELAKTLEVALSSMRSLA